MKFLIKKIYIILFLLIVFFIQTKSFAKTSKINIQKKIFPIIFQGHIIFKINNTEKAFEYLNKVKRLKNTHSEFNIRFIQYTCFVK